MCYTLNKPWDKASISGPFPQLNFPYKSNLYQMTSSWCTISSFTVVQRALLALVDNPPNRRHQLHHRGNQGPTHRWTFKTCFLSNCADVIKECWVISHYFLQILHKLQPILEWMLQQPTTTPLQSSWALGLVFIFWIIPGVIFWPVLRKFLSLSLHLLIRMYIYFVGVCWDNSKYCRLWNLHWCRGWWTY